MPKFQTLVQCLQYWSDTLGDAPAFIFRNRRHERYVLTWNKLRALSGRFAAVLRGWGLTRGHLVVNTLLNSPERVVCEAGILMSGAASVNGECLLADGSDPLLTLSRSRASAIVVDPDGAGNPWDALRRHVSVGDDGSSVTSVSLPELKKVYFARRVGNNSALDFLTRLETHVDWFEADDVKSDDVMSVFTTSGSTGFSKLVPATHGQYMNVSELFAGIHIFFNISPLGWGMGYVGFSFFNGSKRVLCDVRGGGVPEDMTEFVWRSTQEEKCTIALLPPVVSLNRLAVLATSRAQSHERNVETEDVGQSNDTISTRTADSPGDDASEGKAASTHKATTGTVEEADGSDCPGSPGNKAAKQSEANERSPGDEDEDEAPSGRARTGRDHSEIAEAERGENADDSSVAGAPVAWKLNAIFLGGMPITRAMVQAALVLADSVAVVYGSTDFGLVSLRAVRGGDDYADHDCGSVAKGVVVKVVRQDDEDAEMPVNQLGHILVRKQPARVGYLNDPQLTAAAFTKDGYFRTGDVGRLDDRGHLFVEGRGGDAIMRGAYIFYPAWLEARICACPGVDSVVVVGVPDPDLHEELCACVVLRSGDVTMAQVRKFVEKDIVTKENDPLSPRPRYYLRFESFPTTSTDKPRRKTIMRMAAGMLGLPDDSS